MSRRPFHLTVTVNYLDGNDRSIKCEPRSLYDLKKVVEHFIEIEPDATSFVFVVCETHKES